MLSTSSYLNTKIDFLKGVGEKRAELLASELGVRSFFDLLNLFPFRYVDRTEFQLIKDINDDEYVQLKGKIVEKEKIQGRNKRYRLTALFQDSSGFVELIWFQSIKWINEYLREGEEYVVYGKVKVYRGKKSISHPEMELSKTGKSSNTLQPVYHSTEKLNSRSLDNKARRKLIQSILDQLKPSDLPENLSPELLGLLKFPSRFET